MEDILEEIVGNILDEHDEEDTYIEKKPDGTFVMNGMTPLEEVGEALNLDFEDEDTGDTGLYLDGFKFDYYGSEKEHSHNIYMRKGTSLKHIAEELQAKVQYY